MEEPGILQHHAEHAAQVTAFEFRDINAVNQDLAAIDFVEAHQQIDEGGLAGASRTNNRDHLARLGVDIHVFHQDFFRAVTKLDMLELDGALGT